MKPSPRMKSSAAKQFEFAAVFGNKSLAFGGTLLTRAKNRTFRPLSQKTPLHLVLRSSISGQTPGWSLKLPQNAKYIERTIRLNAERFGVRIQEFSNNGNHLHLLLRITNRTLYKRFIKAVTGAIALKITGSNRLERLTKGKRRDGKFRFWDFRPFSRIVVGWKGYIIARDYVVMNALESLQIIPYQTHRNQGRWAIVPG